MPVLKSNSDQPETEVNTATEVDTNLQGTYGGAYDESELLEAARTGRRPQTREEQLTPPPVATETADNRPAPPQIITINDINESEKSGIPLDRPPTKDVKIGKDTDNPVIIKGQDELEALAKLQRTEPKLYKTLYYDGAVKFNQEVSKVNETRRAEALKAQKAFFKAQDFGQFIAKKEKQRTEFDKKQFEQFINTHTLIGQDPTPENLFNAFNGDLPFISNAELKKIQAESPEMAKILIDKGIPAYITAINQQTLPYRKFEKWADKQPDKNKLDLIAAYDAGLGNEILKLYGKQTLSEIVNYKNQIKIVDDINKRYSGDVRAAILDGYEKDKIQLVLGKDESKKVYGQLNAALIAQKKIAELDAKRESGKHLSPAEYTAYQGYINTLETFSQSVQTNISALAGSAAIAGLIPYIDRGSQIITEKLPPYISVPARFIVGYGIERPLYAANFALQGLATITSSNPAGQAKQIATGIADFIMGIPDKVKKDPESLANLVGVFYSPDVVKSNLAKLDVTGYIPYRGFSFRFTTARIPLSLGDIVREFKAGNLKATDIIRAAGDAQKRFADKSTEAVTVPIGKSNLSITLEPTAWNKQLGFALWHGTPQIERWDKNPYVGEQFTVNVAKGGEPALFASTQAAGRFALQSAFGKQGKGAAVILIYTKDGIKTYPAAVTYAKTLAEMKAKGFEYLGSPEVEAGAYPTPKGFTNDYGTFIENENLIAPGTSLGRISNLKTRIFGAPVGEFITVIDGKAVPIFRFAEQGAKVPKVTIADLMAIRIRTVFDTVKDLVSNRYKGFEIKNIESLVSELEKIEKEARIGKVGEAADRAAYEALKAEGTRRLQGIYEPNKGILERIWNRNPNDYENIYTRLLNERLARAYKTKYARLSTPPEPAQIRASLDPKNIRRIKTRVQPRKADIIQPFTVARPELQKIEVRTTGERTRQLPVLRTPETPETRTPETPPATEQPPRPPERPPRPPRVELPPNPVKAPPKLDNKDYQDKARRIISSSDGAIAWRQGQLHGKDRWDVIVSPYKQDDYYIVLGNRPDGVKHYAEGPRSAYKTAQRIRGVQIESPELIDQPGLFSTKLEPAGKTAIDLTFFKDMDIAGRRMKPISDRRTGGLGGRRIAGITPRLRRKL